MNFFLTWEKFTFFFLVEKEYIGHIYEYIPKETKRVTLHEAVMDLLSQHLQRDTRDPEFIHSQLLYIGSRMLGLLPCDSSWAKHTKISYFGLSNASCLPKIEKFL